MIIEWLADVWFGFLGWLLTLIPPMPDDAVIDAQGNVAGLATLVGSLGVWVNWASIAVQVTAVLGFYFTFLVIRMAWSFFGRS